MDSLNRISVGTFTRIWLQRNISNMSRRPTSTRCSSCLLRTRRLSQRKISEISFGHKDFVQLNDNWQMQWTQMGLEVCCWCFATNCFRRADHVDRISAHRGSRSQAGQRSRHITGTVLFTLVLHVFYSGICFCSSDKHVNNVGMCLLILFRVWESSHLSTLRFCVHKK